MLDNAYGTGKTGQEKDLLEFFKKPRVWVRSALFTSHLIALASQASQSHDTHNTCIFNDQHKCNFQMLISILGFSSSIILMLLDFFFVDISSASKRKKICQGELVADATMVFVTFVSFCSIVAGWKSVPIESDLRDFYSSSAKTILTFSSFTIPLWIIQLYFCFMNYRQGYYYLYEIIEQGVLSAFAPVVGDSINPYESFPEPSSGGLNWDQSEFQPTPFSAQFPKDTNLVQDHQVY